MTLVAIHAEADRARILTDTARYNAIFSYVDTAGPKAVALPHLQAVAVSAGSVPAGVVWDATIAKFASAAHSFEQLVQVAPAALQAGARHGHLHAYLVGWSAAAGRFKAFVFAPAEGYQADVSDTFHVRPAPLASMVTEAERVGAEHARQASRFSSDEPQPLPAGDPLEAPADDAGWAALARRVFEARAVAPLDSGRRIPIGGEVTLTTLQGGSVEQRVVHRFTSDDFRRVIAGTLHPLAQVGPCPCGSGQRYVSCHIPQWLTLPCLCESGKTLGDCCALDNRAAADLIAAHPELRDPVPA